MNKLQHFKTGILEELPIQIGVFPFGIIYGMTAIENNLSFWQALLMSSIIFAGASQVAFSQLIINSSPVGIITSIASINSRHFLYGISLNRYLKNLPLRWRLILSYLLTDEAYAVSIKYFSDNFHKENFHYHLLGSGLTLYFIWQISSLTGIIFGEILPNNINLDFVIPLSFIAIVIPMLKKTYHFIAFISSGLVAVFSLMLGLDLWILISAFFGLLSSYCFINLQSKK